MGAPLWNLTPVRSLKVQTLPSVLGDQLSARLGSSASLRLLSKIRNSPVWLSMHNPPASEMVSGLIAPAGAEIATRSVPPFLGLPAGGVVLPLGVEEPHAARIAPSSGADMPIALPRRRNCRRLRRPETSSSM